MGSVLCEHCTGHCCRYIALPIDRPKTARDFDDMRWYLLHGDVLIFVEEGEWYIQFNTRCRHLGPDNRCGIYATRPKICREYSTKGCDYHPDEYEYDYLFTEPEQLEAFAREYLRRRRARSAGPRRRPRIQRAARPRVVTPGFVALRLPSGGAV